MNFLSVNLNPVATGTTIYQGAQAGDPCLNDNLAQWQAYPTSAYKGTMGGRNVWQNGIIPPGGGSSAYPFVSDNSKSLIMRGASMQSIGELGYIHRPEPFTHVMLQPQPVTERSARKIPDWALLDFFTVATNAANPRPTFGRININSLITPGQNSLGGRRLVPLKALLNNVISPPDTVAQNIYDDSSSTHDNRDIYGMIDGREGIFDTIGEVCEVQGLADNPGKNEADREAAIRQIANLITVRSSTFTIRSRPKASNSQMSQQGHSQSEHLTRLGTCPTAKSERKPWWNVMRTRRAVNLSSARGISRYLFPVS